MTHSFLTLDEVISIHGDLTSNLVARRACATWERWRVQ